MCLLFLHINDRRNISSVEKKWAGCLEIKKGIFIMNEVKLIGILETDLKRNHETNGEVFYSSVLHVNRRVPRNGEEPRFDLLPVMISDYAFITLRGGMVHAGDTVECGGELRLARYLDGENTRFERYILITEIRKVPEDTRHENTVHVSGYVMREANYRSGYDESGRTTESSSMPLSIPVNNENRRLNMAVLTSARVARATSSLYEGDLIEITGSVRMFDRSRTVKAEDGEEHEETIRIGYIVGKGLRVIEYAPESDGEDSEGDESETADTEENLSDEEAKDLSEELCSPE